MIILIWIINALAIMLVAYLVPGITVSGFGSALLVALLLGLLNAVIRPLLLILTLPVNILTLGLFTFVINGVMLMIVGAVVKGFSVDGFWTAIIGAIVLSLIQFGANALLHPAKAATR